MLPVPFCPSHIVRETISAALEKPVNLNCAIYFTATVTLAVLLKLSTLITTS